ncbi:fasciclin domain-containing protein [Streptomyces cirratus]
MPKEGADSFDGMAKDPVATAASNNPALSTLLAAVKQAGLVEKLTTKQLENGSFETLEKGMITTSGSGESYKVNDSANVVCGNVKTANANVYIIDSVLMPK